MSVLTFDEIHNGRDGGDDESQGRLVRRYSRVFRAVTDNNSDDASVVLASAPSYGAVYPKDMRAYCRSRSARNESFSKRVWIVTCLYSTEREIQESPLDDPPSVEWGTEQFQRPFYKDTDGDAILNSAGDQYDPPVEGDDSRWTATLTRNVSAVPAWLLTYADAVNSSAFTLDGIAIGERQAKIQAIRLSPVQERNDIVYRVLTITFHFSSDWRLEVLDAGFREKVSDEMKRIKNDGDSEWPTVPVCLNGSGAVLENPTPATAKYNTHTLYEEKSFATLPLT